MTFSDFFSQNLYFELLGGENHGEINQDANA